MWILGTCADCTDYVWPSITTLRVCKADTHEFWHSHGDLMQSQWLSCKMPKPTAVVLGLVKICSIGKVCMRNARHACPGCHIVQWHMDWCMPDLVFKGNVMTTSFCKQHAGAHHWYQTVRCSVELSTSWYTMLVSIILATHKPCVLDIGCKGHALVLWSNSNMVTMIIHDTSAMSMLTAHVCPSDTLTWLSLTDGLQHQGHYTTLNVLIKVPITCTHRQFKYLRTWHK